MFDCLERRKLDQNIWVDNFDYLGLEIEHDKLFRAKQGVTSGVPPILEEEEDNTTAKKNAVAVATVRAGKGVFRVNGSPVDLLEPQALRVKVMEPILLLGLKRFQNIDIRVTVRGGGYVAQIYAIRQAISKGVVAYYQKFVN